MWIKLKITMRVVNMEILGYQVVQDLALVPMYILLLLLLLGVLFISLLAHELGHILWFRLIKQRRVKVKFGWLQTEVGVPSDYEDLSDREYIGVNLWGIVLGLVPIAIMTISFFPYFFMIFPYLWGVRGDLKNIWETAEFEE